MQLAQLSAALVTGGALGLLYDVLKTIRKRTRYKAVAGFLDLLFWLMAVIGLFTLGMSSGRGDIRLFMLAAALIGVVLYMIGPSFAVNKALDFIADLICSALNFCLKPLGMIKKQVKKAKKFKKSLSISNKIVYNNKNQ
jgi:spore cortex biosynthesis protein YabQ